MFDLARPDDDFLLAKPSLQLLAIRRPPCPIKVIRHHLGDYDPITLDLAIIIPDPFGGRVDVQRRPAKSFSQLVSEPIEIRPALAGVRYGKEYLDKIWHVR
ncbi:hypothetical protein BN77_p11645 [Rhizobium mesoamericanum STM3625]|uniref:Uncharacterized protein n=1 Tax=Rhizobium mesoamericanum STM3625 TaxID=1211777 RepID=K0Q3I6_9HYPH|nr:hypothetical protein BN77_p11645 [Rhizobium mesoamericanum STM3625]